MVNSRLQVENVKRNLIVLEFFVFPSVSRVEMRWYTEQLVVSTESWYNVSRTHSDFPLPSSLAGYADRGFSFHERRAGRGSHVSPKRKGNVTSPLF